MQNKSENKILMLKPQKIKIPKNRIRQKIDDYKLRLLTESIATTGIKAPILVRKNGYDRYELVAGEIRLRAALKAGCRRVPCRLLKLDEAEAYLCSLTENMQRTVLTFFDEAKAIKRLTGYYGMDIGEIAAKLGMPKESLLKKTELLKLSPDIAEAITKANLSELQAMEIVKIPAEYRMAALKKILTDGMNDTAAANFVSAFLNPQKPLPDEEESKAIKRKYIIADRRIIENSIIKFAEELKNTGADNSFKKYETEKYIEYRLRIKKEPSEKECEQLKIC